MTSAKIHFHQLNHFMTAADLGSITAAAHALHVSQPTVTISIAKLEEELGLTLFYRDHSGVHVTPAGDALLANARDILSRIDSALADLAIFRKARGKNQKSRIRLGLQPQVAQVLLTPLVEQHVRRYPNIDLVIKEDSGKNIINQLESGELDLAISNFNGVSKLIASEPLIAQEFCLIGSRKSIKDNGKPIRFDDLQDYPLIQGAIDGSMERKEALQKLATARGIKLDFDFNSPVTIRKQLMLTLNRYSVSLYFLFAKEISDGELSARPIREPNLMQFLYLMRRKRGATKTAETVVYNLIRSQVNQIIRQGYHRWLTPSSQVNRDTVELEVMRGRRNR